MGKTTDAFTTRLQTLSDESQEVAELIRTACAQVDKYKDAFDKLMVLHDNRSNAIIAESGNNAGTFEPAIANDGLLKKIEAQLDKQGSSLMGARSERDMAVLAMKNLNATLETETNKFEAYINKKSKSKNPFKSKDSLPEARALLKVADELIKKNEALI